jgi:hypothetical protein
MARVFLELGQWRDASHLPHRRPCRGSRIALLDGAVVRLWVCGTRVSQWKQAHSHIFALCSHMMHESWLAELSHVGDSMARKMCTAPEC